MKTANFRFFLCKSRQSQGKKQEKKQKKRCKRRSCKQKNRKRKRRNGQKRVDLLGGYGTAEGKNGRRITKSRKKTEKRKPNAEKSSTRSSRYLKRWKVREKRKKEPKTVKKPWKKPKRNRKIEQKGRKKQQWTRQKQRKNVVKHGAEAVKIQQTYGRIRKNPLKLGKTRELWEIFWFFRRWWHFLCFRSAVFSPFGSFFCFLGGHSLFFALSPSSFCLFFLPVGLNFAIFWGVVSPFLLSTPAFYG